MIGLKWEIKLEIKFRCRLVGSPASYSGDVGSYLGPKTAVLTKVSRGFSWSLRLNAGTELYIRTLLPPNTSFLIHSLMILPLETV
jgi:hypothetical protein